MGKSGSKRSQNESKEGEEEVFEAERENNEKHPVERANWLSFATFHWMGRLMTLAYKEGLTDEDVPDMSSEEKCKQNTDLLEELWARETAFSDLQSKSRPSFNRVAWKYCRSRIFFTSLIYIISNILGFLTPTILMKKIMHFATCPEIDYGVAFYYIFLLLLCEFGRVLTFTLTWAMSYRTALRLKTATMGLVYRKLLRIGNVNDEVSSKLLNVITSDCTRLGEVILSCQVSIAGPIVLFMSAVYVWYELGWLSVTGLVVFVAAYPLQYFLSKGSGTQKTKAMRVKDERVSLISQVIQHFKFLKMFGWENYLFSTISDVRERERKFIFKGQLFQSFGVIIGPTLPHIAAIITFLIYISSGNDLLPEQAFAIITLYTARIRPGFMRIRSGLRAWFDSKTSISRIEAFTTLFVFSLLFFSIRMVNLLYDSLYTFLICSERVKGLLILPEIKDPNENSCLTNHAAIDEAIEIEDLHLIRRAPVSDPKAGKRLTKEEERQWKKETKNINSIERLLGTGNDDDSASFHLGPLTLHVKKGSFIGICGHVGSGKTTLLETITGSMITEKGTLNTFGRTAYVPQHPWIFHGTLRDNVLFGEPFDTMRYYSCLESCCLTNDISVFPLADKTLLENNGMNLSGGQRQRICLARALYYLSGDIYLLDDCLSGLDDRVAKTVFEKAITGLLRSKNKTVLLATHQLHFLTECDEILVLSDGKIVQRGKHSELLATSNSIYSGLWNNSLKYSNEDEQIIIEDSEMLDFRVDSAVDTAKKVQLELENSRKDVGADVYHLYIKCAGGFVAVLMVILAFTLSTGSTVFSSWWLKHWFKKNGSTYPLSAIENDNDTTNNSSISDLFKEDGVTATDSSTSLQSTGLSQRPGTEYISNTSEDFIFNRNVYSCIISIIFVTSFFRTILFVVKTMNAAKNLHRRILQQFFRIRMKLLEKIGTGSMYNLFSHDMNEVDGSLPNNMESFLQNIFIVLSIFSLVSGVLPSFLIFAVLMFTIFYYYRNVYNAATRDLKRIESRRRTPIFTRISETVKGLGTIRAFNKEKLMNEEFENLTDTSCTATYTFNASMRWLSFRLDSLAVVMTGSVAAIIFFFHGAISGAAAGLALSYAAQLSGVFQFTVRLASETEARFVSVERMKNFLRYDETEELGISSEKTSGRRSTSSQQLSLKIDLCPSNMHPNWPTEGHVKFHGVTLCYSSDDIDVPVLRDVSFEVEAGMNIGIIGRTGSGKSSIGNALFRLTELRSGQIYIDGVDISTISLPKLRNSMCVIPQEPSVFQKSVRFNLDAGNLYEDHELWAVLEKTGLRSSIGYLDSQVGLSHGQKQLLSIARALLRHSKIVFIDEATSSMDAETAAIVEKLIASEFKYSTVFIVAHRTSALTSCQNILIMGDGKVRDYGPASIVSKKPEFKESFDKFDCVSLD